jgi:hypothetical protein
MVAAPKVGRGMKRWLALFLLVPSSLLATTFYVTVSGLGGEPDYEQRFTAYAQDLDKILKQSGVDANVNTLAGQNATREQITSVLTGIAQTAKPADAVVLMMIGHGSYDGVNYKINLPGRDISAQELAALLDKIPATRQLVVNMTSCSGASLDVLKKANRVVITATKSGTERNATVFARYWVDALRDPAADVDKNQTISALEAFRYADQKTAQFYETQKRLATEHALLDDTGKGEGVRDPSPENGAGLQASRFPVLRLGQAQIAANTPEKRALMQKKEDLEQQIDKLKYEKAAMPTDEYKQQLTSLLVELAKTQAALEK